MPKTTMMKTVVNCETGEIVEREFTADEYGQWEIDLAKYQAEKAQAQAKAQAKAELLERLGITADEAKLLLA
jgi:hypothetical protein